MDEEPSAPELLGLARIVAGCSERPVELGPALLARPVEAARTIVVAARPWERVTRRKRKKMVTRKFYFGWRTFGCAASFPLLIPRWS